MDPLENFELATLVIDQIEIFHFVCGVAMACERRLSPSRLGFARSGLRRFATKKT